MTCKILVDDVLARLAQLPDESVDLCVTSPPYWGLRSYLPDGHPDKPHEIGSEPSLGEHLEVMVRVFREVRRVLKPGGSLYLNYGDCYATVPNGRSAAETKAAGTDDRTFRDKPMSTVGPIHRSKNIPRGGGEKGGRWGGGLNQAGPIGEGGGYLKPKDLCMIPNRLAIALQDDSWWVRSEIIWGKANAMPDSSGIWRPATAHEKIFLLNKNDEPVIWRAKDTLEWAFEKPDLSERLPAPHTKRGTVPRWIPYDFFYDFTAVAPERTQDEDAATFRGGSYTNGEPGPRQAKGNNRVPGGWAQGETYKGQLPGHPARQDKQRGHSRRHAGFNGRWDHMSKSEQQERGRFLRNYEPPVMEVWPIATFAFKDAHFATFPPELAARCIRAGCPKGGVVLDPFGGAGTVGLMAEQMGRDSILIELNPEYAELARARIQGDNPLFCEILVEKPGGPIDADPEIGTPSEKERTLL